MRHRIRDSSQAAIPRLLRATVTHPCRPTLQPRRAGSATSLAASTRSSSAPSRRYARRCDGNSPFYGVEGEGWFLNFHCFAKYVKVAFFNGTSLDPLPPFASKDANVRYLNIYEDDQLDEAQFATWVKQASQLPGWGSRDELSRSRRLAATSESVRMR